MIVPGIVAAVVSGSGVRHANLDREASDADVLSRRPRFNEADEASGRDD